MWGHWDRASIVEPQDDKTIAFYMSLQMFLRYPRMVALTPVIGDPCRGSTWGSQSPWQC